jgi:hypothetical protein
VAGWLVVVMLIPSFAELVGVATQITLLGGEVGHNYPFGEFVCRFDSFPLFARGLVEARFNFVGSSIAVWSTTR